MKKQKKRTRLQKLDKYLYKNSYLYKTGKKFFKTRSGKIVLIIVLSYFATVFVVDTYRKHEVYNFVKKWEKYQNNGNFTEFISSIDMSDKNKYRASFPEWKELFFEEGIKLELKDISVSIEENKNYSVKLLVIFRKNKNIINKFTGEIYIRKTSDGFKIYRLST